MKNFTVIGVLKTGEHVTDSQHYLFNKFSIPLLQCKLRLNEIISSEKDVTIYIDEDSEKVFVKLPDGTTSTFE
jgi:hypothetical protein